jgi:hypothetical protein
MIVTFLVTSIRSRHVGPKNNSALWKYFRSVSNFESYNELTMAPDGFLKRSLDLLGPTGPSRSQMLYNLNSNKCTLYTLYYDTSDKHRPFFLCDGGGVHLMF